jgi:hypothetical protein
MANKARIDKTSPVKPQHGKRWRLKQIEEDTLRRLTIIAHYSYSANTCATAKKKIEELQSVFMPRVHCCILRGSTTDDLIRDGCWAPTIYSAITIDTQFPA